MRRKWKAPLLMGVFALLAFTAYVESPNSAWNKDNVYYYSNEESNEAVTVDAIEDVMEIEGPILEMEKINEQVIDGNIIETYQEIETYKDEEGNVVKSVPTTHFDYLKYRSVSE